MFHVKHEDRTPGPELSRGVEERLRAYERLLRDRAIPTGLIAAADGMRLWERHILDSVRGAAVMPDGPGRVADLGSGAGLPGIPIAIARPGLQMTLIESRQRRAAFLELVVERLDLPDLRVLPVPLQTVTERFDVCLARALAPPAEVWGLAEPLLTEAGCVLCWVGARAPRWPATARVELYGPGDLANSGPIAIMTRQ